jgi:hypothetical protein
MYKQKNREIILVSSVSVVTGCCLHVEGSIPGRSRDSSVRQHVYTGFVVHLAFYSTIVADPFVVGKTEAA